MAERSKKYWYRTLIFYCPLCLREKVYRERVYTKKPKDYEDRIVYKELYDYCNEIMNCQIDTERLQNEK